MKRWQVLLFAGYWLSITFVYGQIPPVWQYEAALNDVAAFGNTPKTVQDSNGNLHLVCWNQASDKLVYGFKAFNSDEWLFEWVDSSGNNGYSAAINLDGNGVPHVAYYENIQGKMQLRYANRVAGYWITEVVDSVQTWGQYGLSNQNNEGNVHPSIDLILQPFPIIVFFDATWEPAQFHYGLELKRATRVGGPPWVVSGYGNIPITSVPTSDPDYFWGENIAGARYGEFCNISQSLSGKNYVFTVCNKNGQIIWYPDFMNTNYVVLDSVIRYRVSTDILQLTFEGLSVAQGSNGDYHLSYALSHQYGRNDYTPELSFFYARLNPTDSSTVVSEIVLPRDAKYRYNTSIAVQGNDSIIISFIERDTRKIRLAKSWDGGQTWTFQNVFSSTITDYPAPIIWKGDSLTLVCYDIEKEKLNYASIAVNTGFIRSYSIQKSTLYARQNACTVTENGQDKTIDALFSDELSQELWLGQKKNNWTFSQINTGKTYQNLRLLVRNNGERYLMWYETETQQLVASAEGATPITLAFGASTADWVSRNDSIHLIYYNQGNLWYRFGTSLANLSPEVAIDTINQGAAGAFKIIIDPYGLPHVAFQNIGTNKLFYLKKTAFGLWIKSEVTLPNHFTMGSWVAIAVGASLQPQIVCRNAATNSLHYFIWKASSWVEEVVYQAISGVAGAYFEIQLDTYENPFVAFSLLNTSDQVRIFKKAYSGTIWYSLPVYQNVDQIGSSFSFQLTQNDVYILGKRNRIGSTGLGLLYSPDGVWASVEDVINSFQGTLLYPNPTNNDLFLTTQLFELNAQNPVSYQINSISGQLVDSGVIYIENPKIDVQNLQPGIYFGTIKLTNGVVLSQKFVKLP
ncbi:MAG: T9SS type A sorting domain-containing protein [Bacteroidia bacterium]|nr:T9SS type A sorting domain-containing protein [Bacteroidia bacterium]